MAQAVRRRRGLAGGPRRLGQTRPAVCRPAAPASPARRARPAEQPRQRAGRRLRPAAQDGSQRPRHRQRRHPSRTRCRAAASRPARSAMPTAIRAAPARTAQGQRRDRGLHRLGEGGRVEAARGIVERGEVQHEARHVRAVSLPHRRGRRAVAQQQQPVQPLGQRHFQPGAQRPLARPAGSRHRPQRPASPARRRAPGRPGPRPPHRPRPPAGSPAAAAHRDPRPPSRGASARPARSGSPSWPAC